MVYSSFPMMAGKTKPFNHTRMNQEKENTGSGKKWIVIAIVAIVIVGGIYYVVRHNGSAKKTNSSDSSVTATKKDKSAKAPAVAADTTSGQKLKFTDQDYAKNSYLISGDAPLSADAKLVLTGYAMSKQVNTDKTVTITLKALKSEYHDQSYTLKPGEQLYFIEKFLQDDQNENETNLHDDTAAIVAADGTIVEEPRDFSK